MGLSENLKCHCQLALTYKTRSVETVQNFKHVNIVVFRRIILYL
jgi:hypothetical protein